MYIAESLAYDAESYSTAEIQSSVLRSVSSALKDKFAKSVGLFQR